MKTILLTGFAPFGGEKINPSWELAKQLDGKMLNPEMSIVALELPCAFGSSLDLLSENIQKYQPEMVLCMGQAGGRVDITIERVAINVDDARMPDNQGAQPVDLPVIEGGPVGYFTTLPLKSIVQALRLAGIPASVSHSAGTYVCNHIFYGLMHFAQQKTCIRRAGFVHIPFLPEQAILHPGAASMSLQMMIDGILIVLETALAVQDDIKLTGGTTH